MGKPKKITYKEGDLVQVIGYANTTFTSIGLYGYITKIYTLEDEETPKYLLNLLQYPEENEDPERQKQESEGRYQAVSIGTREENFRPIKGKTQLARAQKFRDLYFQPTYTPPKIANSVKRKILKKSRKDTAIASHMKKMRPKFPLPGKVERGNKSQFPSYQDPVCQKRWRRVMTLSQGGYSTTSPQKLAEWRLCNEANSQCSFWSGHPECRNLIHELDLDPFKAEFATALYKSKTRVYAPLGTLRNAAIQLWNQGYEILYIQEMTDAETCHNSSRTEPPKGFQITAAKRRKLPQPN